MAKPTKNSTQAPKGVPNVISNLIELSRSTSFSTYNIEKDLFDTDRILDKLKEIQERNKDSVKKTVDGGLKADISSRMNDFGLFGGRPNSTPGVKNGSLNQSQPNDIFDVIKNNSAVFQELRQMILMDNKFYELINDYEILRRAIPEISRVINLLINSVIIPEVITSDTFSISHHLDTDTKKDMASNIKHKYELDKKIRTIVENYFVIGVEYITVVPYRAVIEAIKRDNASAATKSKIIKESSLLPEGKSFMLNESSMLDMLTDSIRNHIDRLEDSKAATRDMTKKFNTEVNNYLKEIKVYKTSRKLVYDSALVESVMTSDDFMFESAFEDFFSDNKNIKMRSSVADHTSSEGLIQQNKEYDKIKINGCKIERLDPARVYPIRMKDTVVAYVYIEERRDDALRFNLQNTMQNTFSFYRMNSQTHSEFNMKKIEDRMIREIGNRIIENLSPKFLEANFNNMDIFYEFLRDNAIHRQQRDIILIHPDDIIEFKRADGSIMKNAVFFAKMYLLLLLNNILIKVRRGSDRTMYFVSNGLSNDIEASVMDAIVAIQQSEVRLSDLGSISSIIGTVGSTVDLFLPQTEDGHKPVNAEVLAGQDVDMDSDFLKFLIKSIILSFNMPSVVVDVTNEVEFAKTLSMANLDVATSSALAQAELNAPLTELVRRVMQYDLELTDEEVKTIEASFIPSRSMLMQITNDLIDTTKNLATTFSELFIVDDADPINAKRTLFTRDFIREYFTYDFRPIDKILKKIEEDTVAEKLKADMETSIEAETTDGDDMADDSGGGDSY